MFAGNHSSKYWPYPTLLNCAAQMRNKATVVWLHKLLKKGLELTVYKSCFGDTAPWVITRNYMSTHLWTQVHRHLKAKEKTVHCRHITRHEKLGHDSQSTSTIRLRHAQATQKGWIRGCESHPLNQSNTWLLQAAEKTQGKRKRDPPQETTLLPTTVETAD